MAELLGVHDRVDAAQQPAVEVQGRNAHHRPDAILREQSWCAVHGGCRTTTPSRRAWLARLAVGATGVVLMTDIRGSSDLKAQRELGWRPVHASWRTGFLTVAAGG